jgi:hypothetical protein
MGFRSGNAPNLLHRKVPHKAPAALIFSIPKSIL